MAWPWKGFIQLAAADWRCRRLYNRGHTTGKGTRDLEEASIIYKSTLSRVQFWMAWSVQKAISYQAAFTARRSWISFGNCRRRDEGFTDNRGRVCRRGYLQHGRDWTFLEGDAVARAIITISAWYKEREGPDYSRSLRQCFWIWPVASLDYWKSQDTSSFAKCEYLDLGCRMEVEERGLDKYNNHERMTSSFLLIYWPSSRSPYLGQLFSTCYCS